MNTNIMLATDLHRLVHNATLFASKDDTLPMIELIRLEFTQTQVISVATDRYVLGVTRAELITDLHPGEPMVIQLARPDAEKLVKIAKTGRNVVREVDISLTAGIGGSPDRVAFAFSTGEALAVEVATDEFPRFRQLIPAEPKIPETGGTDGDGTWVTGVHVAVNPTNMARFTKVIDSHAASSVALTVQGPAKPVLVTVGPDFLGLLMPVKGYAPFMRPAWLDEVVTVVTEAGAA